MSPELVAACDLAEAMGFRAQRLDVGAWIYLGTLWPSAYRTVCVLVSVDGAIYLHVDLDPTPEQIDAMEPMTLNQIAGELRSLRESMPKVEMPDDFPY